MKYYRVLRELIKIYGSESLVFIDESGFEEFQACFYAWSKKGKKVFGDRQGKRGKRETLSLVEEREKKTLLHRCIYEKPECRRF